MSVRSSYLDYDFSPIVSKLNESCRYPTILVEGKNDSIIYSQILGEKCIISCNGKDNVIKELTEYPRKNKIAIVDVDYDEKEDIDNLFYTDYNDL